MKRIVALCAMLFFAVLAHAQGFPDAQKQPKMKEQHHNHKKYKALGHRDHVKPHREAGRPPKKY